MNNTLFEIISVEGESHILCALDSKMGRDFIERATKPAKTAKAKEVKESTPILDRKFKQHSSTQKLRNRILQCLDKSRKTTAQIARAIGRPYPATTYHVRAMLKDNTINQDSGTKQLFVN